MREGEGEKERERNRGMEREKKESSEYLNDSDREIKKQNTDRHTE